MGYGYFSADYVVAKGKNDIYIEFDDIFSGRVNVYNNTINPGGGMVTVPIATYNIDPRTSNCTVMVRVVLPSIKTVCKWWFHSIYPNT